MLSPSREMTLRSRRTEPLPESVDKTSYWTAGNLFWQDLNENLRSYLGRWLAYTTTGLYYVGHAGADDLAVHRYCIKKGLTQYFVGHAVPDLPVEWIPDDWVSRFRE